MSAVAFPILLLVVLVLTEMLILNRNGKNAVDWHDVVFNLNSGHLMLWLFRGLEIAVYSFILRQFSFHLLENWPPVLLWLFAILLWDFCFYWLHRLHHRFAVLWAVHVVHHEGEHFNLSLAVRNSWYSSLASIPFFIPMALIGVPLPVFITVSILHYSIQLMNHSALTPRLGWLEQVIVTPSHHRIHHVKDRAFSDSNYGGSFVFWDKWFGTYRPDLPQGDFSYGVRGDDPSRNPLIASNSPFMRFLLRRAASRASSQPRYASSGPALLLATIILFVLVTGYIWLYGYGYQGGGLEQASLFALLAAGAIALGGISEGRIWALYAWLLIAWAMLLGFALGFGWQQPFWLIGMGLLALHASAMLLGWGRSPIAPLRPASMQ